MATDRGDLLTGTLDMLVLKALQLEPMHGWGITEGIEHWSESVLQPGQGTLYPALYRLERQGLIQSDWKVTENNRRARYYSLTWAGRRQLTAVRRSGGIAALTMSSSVGGRREVHARHEHLHGRFPK